MVIIYVIALVFVVSAFLDATSIAMAQGRRYYR
jgi:hypothetical protein